MNTRSLIAGAALLAGAASLALPLAASAATAPAPAPVTQSSAQVGSPQFFDTYNVSNYTGHALNLIGSDPGQKPDGQPNTWVSPPPAVLPNGGTAQVELTYWLAGPNHGTAYYQDPVTYDVISLSMEGGASTADPAPSPNHDGCQCDNPFLGTTSFTVTPPTS